MIVIILLALPCPQQRHQFPRADLLQIEHRVGGLAEGGDVAMTWP